MAFNYAVHNKTETIAGARPYPAPMLPIALGASNPGQVALAADTQSATIVGPCEVHMHSDDKARVDCRALADAADLDPATSPVIIPADALRVFILDKGSYVIEWSAA